MQGQSTWQNIRKTYYVEVSFRTESKEIASEARGGSAQSGSHMR